MLELDSPIPACLVAQLLFILYLQNADTFRRECGFRLAVDVLIKHARVPIVKWPGQMDENSTIRVLLYRTSSSSISTDNHIEKIIETKQVPVTSTKYFALLVNCFPFEKVPQQVPLKL